MWTYLIKVNIAMVVFFGIYRWFYRNDTFFELRRSVLLSLMAVAFLYPFIQLESLFAESKALADASMIYTSIIPSIEITASPVNRSIDWSNLFSFLYFGIGGVLLLRLLDQVIQVLWLRYRCRPTHVGNTPVYQLTTDETPFSFFHWIFLRVERHTPDELQEILEHEQVHARQQHTADVLLTELAVIACWFNPLVWLLRMEVKKNLEFIADRGVVQRGFGLKGYQHHLVKMAHQNSAMQICNNINVSPLKERIIMLNRKRTHKARLATYLLLIPVVLAFALINSMEAAATSVIESTLSSIETTVAPIITHTPESVVAPQQDDKVFTYVDQMPRFLNGGEEGVTEFIAKNTRLLDAAQKLQKAERVICNFTVRRDGSISDVEILRGISPEFDAEAVRVLKSMPKWTPGKHKGEPASVKFTVPVYFYPPKKAATGSNGTKTSSVDQPASYPGGENAMKADIARGVEYPVEAAEKGIQGTVKLEVTINADGSIGEIKPTGPNELLIKEAVRLARTMQKFTPAMKDGKPVVSTITFPVKFRLS